MTSLIMIDSMRFLLLALDLANQRRGFCAPNPAVGAVVVKNNQVIAEGFHWASGQAHAEVVALEKLAPGEARGASLYVTLEPCCHWGKTPPCTDAIIQAGISTVFFGHIDPNPEVAGRSRALLEQAGIECVQVNVEEIKHFYSSYDYWRKYNKPYVTAKLALSLNGKIADKEGKPISITGESLRVFTHQQRKKADAILTTAKTILADDPQLNVRLDNESYSKPVYILDSQLTLSSQAKILTTAKEVTLFYDAAQADPSLPEAWQQKGVQCIAVPYAQTGLNLLDVIHYIGAKGVHDLWVEAGGSLFQTLLQQQLIQRALIYIALKWFDEEAVSAFKGRGNILDSAHHVAWKQMGNDVMSEIIF